MTEPDIEGIFDRKNKEELGYIPGKQVAKYADESMFVAEKTEALTPRVTLIHANNDPLGQLAQLGMMYQGKSVRNLAEITDEDRRYYFKDGRKNILGMPSEAIVFHFLIENVTRSYTHQLVRTRHASYAQESLRFAVKEDFPVALPPSLAGTKDLDERALEFCLQMGWDPTDGFPNSNMDRARAQARSNRTEAEIMRDQWDDEVDRLARSYNILIHQGMPAEDARGLLPHNILTKVNMVISLRALMGMAGQRLCTQAQFEHRQVWDQLLAAMRTYGHTKVYARDGQDEYGEWQDSPNSGWQFDAMANQFLPICYQTGKCQFESDFDRYCNIRDRVQANAKIGRPSSEWNREWLVPVAPDYDPLVDLGMPTSPPFPTVETRVGIPAINPQEWLHPNAAIQPDGLWRSQEAQENIKDRRL